MLKKMLIAAVLTAAIVPGLRAVQEPSADLKNLIRMLKSNSDAEHRQAVEKLMALGPRAAAAIPGLIEALEMGTFFWDGPDERGKMTGGSIAHADSAVAILAAIGPPAVEPLVRYIKARPGEAPSDRANARAAAIRVLGRIKDERAVEPLLQALKERDYSIRAAAAEALLAFPNPAILDRLRPALNSANSDAREIAAWILIHKKDGRVMPAIQKKLQSPYPDVRQDGVRDLETFGGPRAVALLTGLLKDPDPDVQKDAAAALKRLESKDPRAGEN